MASESYRRKQIEAIYRQRGLPTPANINALARRAATESGYINQVVRHADRNRRNPQELENFNRTYQAPRQPSRPRRSTSSSYIGAGQDRVASQSREQARARIEAIYRNAGARAGVQLPLPANIDAQIERAMGDPNYFNSIRQHAERNANNPSELDRFNEEYGRSGGGAGGPQEDPFEKQRRRDARAEIESILNDYGLGDVAGWAWGLIQSGASPDEVLLQMYDESTEGGKAFYKRFPGIKLRREKGLPPIKPAEYINYEETAIDLMRQANLPEGFYDSSDDLAELIGNNVSPQALAKRIQKGYQAVAQAPVEVRQSFAEYFGPNGDSALAAFFLDPDRAEAQLIEAAETAEVGGTGLRFGLELRRDRSQRIARLGRGQADVENRFRQVRQRRNIFSETIGELDDFTAEREGIDASFGIGDPMAEERLRKRVESRVSYFQQGGGSLMGQQGLLGLQETE